MSGFGMLVEDPFYDEDGVLIDKDFEGFEEPSGWADVDTAPLATIVDGWIRKSVAEKQQTQEELSPFITINS